MADNFIGPWFIKLFYTSLNGTREHQMQFPVNGTGTWEAGAVPHVLTKGLTTLQVSTAVDNYLDAVAPMFSSDDSFDRYEAYYQPTFSVPPSLIEVGDPAAVGAAGSGADQLRIQFTWSFKTSSRGGLRIVALEQVILKDLRYNSASIGATAAATVASFIVSDDNFLVGRNGEFPLILLHGTSKESDYWRKIDLGI